MKAYILNHIKKMAFLLLGSAVLGILLLTLAFCIPEASMRKHAADSVGRMLMSGEQAGDSAFSKYIWKERETYTDAIMIQNALEKVEGRNAYEHAIWAYHYDLDEDVWTPEESLKALCSDWNTDNMYLHVYARYWHGYLLYLKPLLVLFSWRQIVALGILFQAVMMAALLALAIRRGKPGIGAAMLAGFFFMKPVLVLISLTMSVCWIITLAAMLIMLLCHDRLEKEKVYPEFFLLIGIMVGYFDFLTYPVVTLGFPLCTYFLLKGGEVLKENLGRMIGYSASWGIGYAGMWGMKWIIADLTLHTGTIKDAAWSIIGRTESIGGRSRMNGGWYVISLNLQEYHWKAYLIVAALLAVFALTALAFAVRFLSLGQIAARVLPYLLIFCVPFAWIIVVQHHSALHARFTFRIISVAALAVCCIGLSLTEAVRKNNLK